MINGNSDLENMAAGVKSRDEVTTLSYASSIKPRVSRGVKTVLAAAISAVLFFGGYEIFRNYCEDVSAAPAMAASS